MSKVLCKKDVEMVGKTLTRESSLRSHSWTWSPKSFFFFTAQRLVGWTWPGTEPRPGSKAPNHNHWSAKEVSKYCDYRPQSICSSHQSLVSQGMEDHVSMWLWALRVNILQRWHSTQHLCSACAVYFPSPCQQLVSHLWSHQASPPASIQCSASMSGDAALI